MVSARQWYACCLVNLYVGHTVKVQKTQYPVNNLPMKDFIWLRNVHEALDEASLDR
jgi:hypothetical protein